MDAFPPLDSCLRARSRPIGDRMAEEHAALRHLVEIGRRVHRVQPHGSDAVPAELEITGMTLGRAAEAVVWAAADCATTTAAAGTALIH